MSKRRCKSIVLDTSAFIAGFNPLDVEEDTYSVPEVETELLDSSIPKIRFNMSVESGKLKVIKPSPKYIDLVKSTSSEIGDIGFLSEADMSVLALAVQLKENGQNPIIITDDYSIQNVAEKLRLEFTPLASFGIRYQLHWLFYCPACGKKYPPNKKIMICENCGTQLKRKPLKRTPVKNNLTTNLKL
ncbi:MAG: ribonuclease VapC [Candidatus Bathyarchaeia archaeon]